MAMNEDIPVATSAPEEARAMPTLNPRIAKVLPQLGALEDLVDVGGGAAIRLGIAHAIGHEAPGVHEVPRRIDCSPVLA